MQFSSMRIETICITIKNIAILRYFFKKRLDTGSIEQRFFLMVVGQYFEIIS